MAIKTIAALGNPFNFVVNTAKSSSSIAVATSLLNEQPAVPTSLAHSFLATNAMTGRTKAELVALGLLCAPRVLTATSLPLFVVAAVLAFCLYNGFQPLMAAGAALARLISRLASPGDRELEELDTNIKQASQTMNDVMQKVVANIPKAPTTQSDEEAFELMDRLADEFIAEMNSEPTPVQNPVEEVVSTVVQQEEAEEPETDLLANDFFMIVAGTPAKVSAATEEDYGNGDGFCGM